MLQPSNRPDGSVQVLRFTGPVDLGGPIATFPKDNGTFSSDTGTPGGYSEIRLALADVIDLANARRRLPSHDFDDSQLAGASPHAPVPGLGVAIDGLSPTEQDISARTWCQNTYVTVQPLDTASAAALTALQPVLSRVVLDGIDSGLGLDTGVPVLVLFVMIVGAPASIHLDILIEVRHTGVR